MKKHPTRDTFLSVHHLIPKARKMKNTYKPHNLLRIWRDKHDAFDRIFSNDTLDEIISMWSNYHFKFMFSADWQIVFHKLDFSESLALLKRLRRLKKRRNFNQALPL